MKDFQTQANARGQTPPPVPPKSTNLATAVPVPEQLQCAQCKQFKTTACQFWWCRSCQKTLCSNCNLMQRHTEHRTVPWRPDELVRSLMDTVEARCAAREHRAAEEEAAIKAYMKEVEGYFLEKLHRQLNERNQEDRSLTTVVCAAAGVSTNERKMWPPASHSPTVCPNSPPSKRATLVGFELLTDESVARLMNEISQLLPADGSRTLTVLSKSPRSNSTRNSTCSSPLLSGDRRSFSATRSSQGPVLDGNQDGRSGGSQRFYSFAAVLPDIEPQEFAQILEQQQKEVALRSRSRSQSGPRSQHARSSTPFVEHVSSRAQSPAPGVNGTTTLSVYGSIDVDAADNASIPSREAASCTLPISSTTTVTTQAIIHDHKPKEEYTAKYNPQQKPDEKEEEQASSVQLMVSEDTQTSGCWLTSATQTEIIGNGSIRMTSTPNCSPGGTRRENGVQDSTETSTESGKSNGDTNGTGPTNVTAFHFGSDYLTRPIDVRPLPQGKLAVSDSCGGVYITNFKGDVEHQIPLDGYSASSLCYLTPNRPADENRLPPLLLVSVLTKHNRCVNFYNTRDLTLLDTVACPTEPPIDMGRSRWLAADDRGAVFMVSGDGKLSALWKYLPATKGWSVLKQAQKSRYQYLDVVHTMTDPTSVTLLTCDGLRGSLLLFTVSRNSSSHGSKILSEEDFTQTYGLGQFIRSPASAVVDYHGNMLILDYSTGKLWLLRASNSTGRSKAEGDRRLKMLADIGPQQGVGLSVTGPWDGHGPYGDHWCYIACYNKKRVRAIKYLQD